MATEGRKIPIDPFLTFWVDAIPAPVLTSVFGGAPIDSQVEYFVLKFEYLASTGWTRSELRNRTLTELRRLNFDAKRLDKVIELLKRRGVVRAFFDLTVDAADTNREFRTWLQQRGVETFVIRYYRSNEGFDIKGFCDGFVFGLASSFATIVTDTFQLLVMLGNLQAQLQMHLLRTGERFIVAPIESTEQLANAICTAATGLPTLMERLIGEICALSPLRFPRYLLDKWNEFDHNFSHHLENLEMREAGQMLGRLAGDLWNLLTGIIAAVAVLRIAFRAAVKYGPILTMSVIDLTAEALKQVSAFVVQHLKDLGDRLKQGIEIGLIAAGRFFEKSALREFFEGRLAVAGVESLLIGATAPELALAGAGSFRGNTFMVMSRREGPAVVAGVERNLRPPRASAAAAAQDIEPEVRLFSDREIDDFLSTVLADDPGPADAASVARRIQEAQRTNRTIEEFANSVATKAYNQLAENSSTPTPLKLGRRTDKLSNKGEWDRLFADFDPKVVKRYSEIRNSSLIEEVRKACGGEASPNFPGLPPGETVLQHLERNKDALEDMFGKEAREWSKDEIAAEMRRWDHTPNTLTSDMRSDCAAVDLSQGVIHVFDLTSNTNMMKFDKLWQQLKNEQLPPMPKISQVPKDKAGWGPITQAWQEYAKALREKGIDKSKVARTINELKAHAHRETVLRQSILQKAFGDYFRVFVREALYPNLDELAKNK